MERMKKTNPSSDQEPVIDGVGLETCPARHQSGYQG